MTNQENHLPESVNEIAENAILSVKSHPQHYLEWQIRQELYRSFGHFSDRKVQLARGWLAILAAQKVLPIFTNQLPYYSLPLQLISTAIDELSPYIDANSKYEEEVLEANKHAERMDTLLEMAYHTLGHENLTDQHGNTFYKTDMAAIAANKALQEAKGWEDPFHSIDRFFVGTKSNEGFMKLGNQTNSSDWEPITQYSEEDWIYLAAVGDTAGAAAIAFSYNTTSSASDADRLEEFWLWWLKEALPESWQLANWSWVSK